MERERRQMRRRGNGTENKNKNTSTRVLDDNKGNMASDCPVAIVDSSNIWALSDDRQEAKQKDVVFESQCGKDAWQMRVKFVDQRQQK